MSIEHNLRRIAQTSASPGDPYWANVSLLMNTTGTTGATTDRALVDESGNTTGYTLGTYTRFSALSPFTGYQGSFYNIGDSQYAGGIQINNSSISFSGNFTVEFWAMVPSGTPLGGYPSPIISSSNYGFFASGPVSNTWVVTAQYSGDTWNFVSTITSNDGVWRHIALVRNGTSTGNLKLYIDGVNIPGNATTQTTAYNSTFNWNGSNLGSGVGSGPGAGDNQYYGYLACMRFSNVARYTSNFTPSTTPFITDSNTMFLSYFKGGMLDVSNNKFPMNQLTTSIVQSSSNEKFSGVQNMWLSNNSVTDYLQLIDINDGNFYPTINNLNLLGDFTIECWLYVANGLSQNSSTTVFMSNGISYITLTTNSAGLPNRFGVILSPGGTLDSGVTSNDGNWHFIAIVRNGTVLRLYVDGIYVASTTYTTTVNFSSAYLFSQGTVNTTNFNGRMDQLRITKGVARYTTSTFTVPTQPFPTH